MGLFIRHVDGEGFEHVTPRREVPTAAQSLNRRHALWHHALSVGLYDPAMRRVRRHTVAEIAAVWDVTPRAVRMGIDNARAVLARRVDEDG